MAGNTEERDANLAARRIESYWAGLGYRSVSCRVERVLHDPNGVSASYEVRCNLENGLPPDFRREDLRRLDHG